jgi:hypothetical protein
VTAPVQHSPHAAALAVYLVLGQHLLVECTTGLLAELFGTPMAAGLEPFTAAAGVLPEFTEISVHDAFASYARCSR